MVFSLIGLSLPSRAPLTASATFRATLLPVFNLVVRPTSFIPNKLKVSFCYSWAGAGLLAFRTRHLDVTLTDR